MTLYLNNAPTNINLYITPHVVTFRIYEFQINIYGFRLRGLGTAFAYLCQYNCHHLYEYRFIRPIYISFIHHDIASVGGVTVSMVAFQAVDPGSTPGRRTHFTANHLFIFIFFNLGCVSVSDPYLISLKLTHHANPICFFVSNFVCAPNLRASHEMIIISAWNLQLWCKTLSKI